MHPVSLLGSPSGQILHCCCWSKPRRGPRDHQHCSCVGSPENQYLVKLKATIATLPGTFQGKKLRRVNEPVARKRQKVAIDFYYSTPTAPFLLSLTPSFYFPHRTTRRRRRFTVPPSMDTLMWFLCCSTSWLIPPWETAGRRRLWTWPLCMDGWRSVRRMCFIKQAVKPPKRPSITQRVWLGMLVREGNLFASILINALTGR